MEMKSLSEIAVNLITYIHDTIPEADTKEGTFIRDIFIDPVAEEIATLYRNAKLIELAQSILTASDSDLDKLAKNYFVERKGATQSSGKLRFYIGTDEPTYDVNIPRGTIVSTLNKTLDGSKYYITTDTAIILAGNRSTYQKDIITENWYVDIEAVSQQSGSEYNASAGTIVQISSNVDSIVSGVTNPFSFTGGTDAEDDASLILRMSLVISGSNIGTKDGYRSFVLSQSGVEDAIVIGAKDPLMTRDGGEGGMVDIYVRAEQTETDQFDFDVDYEYITESVGHTAYADIPFRRQPVISVSSITGRYSDSSSETGYIERSYINGSNFKVEKGTSKYFQDIVWDTAFTDVSLTNLTGEDLLKAEATNSLNAKLKRFLAIKDSDGTIYYDKKLTDVSYLTDFSLINPLIDSTLPADVDFYRGYYSNGTIQLILSKPNDTNAYIGGRYFVQKDGKLFERTYGSPDFLVYRDNSTVGNSVNAKDAIKWLPNSLKSNVPRAGETLSITYSYNTIITDLQEKIEAKRVLTADVLIKGAKRIPIEVKLEVVPNVGYTDEAIRKAVINQISTFINDQTPMGGEVDRSDIVYVVKSLEGINSVNTEKVLISVEDAAPIQQIGLSQQEYMELVNIYVKVLPAGTIV
ncbi:Baseplate J-like protein [compost metagenome]